MKNQKGITLVALVITIIVLLILAGVSISLVVGDNGVLTRAGDASDKTKLASASGAVQTALAGCQSAFAADTYVSNYNAKFWDTLTQGQFVTELNNAGYYLFTESGGSYTEVSKTSTTKFITSAPTSGSASTQVYYVSETSGSGNKNYYKVTFSASFDSKMSINFAGCESVV